MLLGNLDLLKINTIMKKNIFKYFSIALALFFVSCDEENYEFGDILAPSNVALNITIVGADDDNPTGDGSGKIMLEASASNAFSYKFSIDGIESIAPSGMMETTLTKTGVEKYAVTAVAIGPGGTTSSISQQIEVFVDFQPDPSFFGAWKLAPEPGALGVGPAVGNYSWWSSDAAVVADRACLFDDLFIFNEDGTFQNVMGDSTWLELGVAAPTCAAPVAPHDGSNPATFSVTKDFIVINGLGAFLGLYKVHNTGEDGVPIGNTITYNYTHDIDNGTLEITITGFNTGVPEAAWYYKFIKAD